MSSDGCRAVSDGDLDGEPSAEDGAPSSGSHTATILGHRQGNGDVGFLVRLRQEHDHKSTFFIKTGSDFEELGRQLKKAVENQKPGEASQIRAVPEMPSTGRFGFRRTLSRLGMSDFLETQMEALQKAVDELLAQVTDLSKEPALCAFFTEAEAPSEVASIREWVRTLREPVNLLSISGFWRLVGSKRTWTIHSDGSAHLDGRHRGEQYDFLEHGEPGDFARVIKRRDGWSVDLERSTKDRLTWVSPGKAELEWHRVPKDEAEAALRAVEKLKAGLRKQKEAEEQALEEAEKEQIRQTILQRTAASAASAKAKEAAAPQVEATA